MPEKIQQTAMTHSAFLEALASLREMNGDLEGAQKLLEQAIAMPGSPLHETAGQSTKLHLAQLLAKLGRGAEAETIVSAIVDTHPNDADAWHTRMSAAGLDVTPIADQPWGMREFTLTDPFGNHVRIGRGSDDSG